ncbi:U4/U6 small nuclear ribonucleoprotein Prp31 [Zootermopsis nevadensis]|uniref:U4/U6 small nuclear ribonucleoprotein Prp31 n=1 Tax=Zootermopsis nevadensis TaxID=136037 RepID=A0A067RFN2_ZOONE|nr:U4/U6 small nuclear ribonucleoprotein Prp31 [Zootermopsis nevadensis]KDR18987.1 U4/U6 small nuclear ribonucleoprotein Prp31 [Zootermopsis nevadensis]
MSLADELLADLEEQDQDDVKELYMDSAMSLDVSPNPTVVPMEEDIKITSIREIAKLRDSKRLRNIMDQIDDYSAKPRKAEDIVGPVEADPEYQLIVEANNVAVDIDNEVTVIHRFTRDKYSKRFPELESLVVGPLEYVMTVKELGNDLDKAKNNEALQQILTQATIMVVSVTASTTQGQLLADHEKEDICEACDMAIEINNFKQKIYDYVESRMAFIAPNLSIIVGASTAAKIMGVAGGLTKLSKMPACNVMVLGSQKKTLSGFSQVTMLPHTGFIYYSDIVQDTPPDLRRKAARLVAAKSTLAARVDACHESSDGHVGQMFREEIEKKLDKLTEPPPVKFIKPLPKPIDAGRKKRGGKRVRKMKERYAMTEFRKQANRLNFADIEDDAYQEDLGYTRGTIGKTGTGRIRLPQIDEKTKVRISKTLQKNLQKQQQVWGGSTTVKKQVSGTASSVAFTPLQGLEIVNPQAAEKKVNEANAKYFSNTSGFLKLQKA